MPSRRSFLQASALGSLSGSMGFWSGTSALTAAESANQSPNDLPLAGFIGTGIRYHNALGSKGLLHSACAMVCDVDLIQMGRGYQTAAAVHLEHERPIDIAMTQDYRHVLERQDIDVVFIGTPDHWHTKIAIEAMQAGKDVYCEKPLTLTIREGQQILKVLKETKRVFQVGSQQRTEYDKRFALATALVRAGRIGKIKRVTASLTPSRFSDALPLTKTPQQLDWETWSGQAPLKPYREGKLVDTKGWGAGFPLSRAHNYFRWWYEYSGGKLTDWGAHHVDCSLWALDKDRADVGLVTIDPLHVKHPVPFVDGYPTQDDRFNTATEFKVRCTFDDGIELMVRHEADDLGFRRGIMFEGEDGRFFVNRNKITGRPVEELQSNPLPEDALANLYGGKVPEDHMSNFFECVRTRETPASDVESHHRSMAICHAINVALRLGRKLTYDTSKEVFVDDPQANTFIEREQRKGYEIVV